MKLEFKSISMLAFCAFAVKFLIQQDISAFQATSLLICAAFVAFYEYKATVDQLKEQNQKIELLRKELAEAVAIQKDVITNISSIKMIQNIKTQGTRGF